MQPCRRVPRPRFFLSAGLAPLCPPRMRLVAVLLVVAACAATPQHDAAPPLAPGGVKQAPAARAVADLHEADAATLLDRDLDDYLAAAQPVRFVRDEVRGAGFAAALAEDAPPAKQDTTELAKKTQNPVADLISLPIQNNTNFGYGVNRDDVQNVLNIQPVIPVSLNDDWNLITRTILPVIYQPEIVPGQGSEFGLGDTSFTGFFSPKDAGKWIWGVGPVLLLPTSTDSQLGAGEWGAGASAVVLTMPSPWVVGAVINNVWSFDGSVNQMLLQYFVNYNLGDGLYLTSAPIILANWEATSDNVWTVPFGAGVGKVFRIGNQPVNMQISVYYNVERPNIGPEWQLRFQVQLLFPK